MVPSVFLAVESLPLLANGKVDKKALPEPPEPEAGAGAGKGSEGYAAPANEVNWPCGSNRKRMHAVQVQNTYLSAQAVNQLLCF